MSLLVPYYHIMAGRYTIKRIGENNPLKVNNEPANPTSPAGKIKPNILITIALGTLLNPLNSSMVSVALLSIQNQFKVDIVAITWVISGFYLAGAIGQPLMGRLADLFGPRRIFTIGLIIVFISSLFGPFAPGFGWLVLARALQALGTSASFPAGMAIFRSVTRTARPPAGAMGVISMAASTSAALGPGLGGILVSLAGWPAIFIVNLPVTLLGLFFVLRYLPPDKQSRDKNDTAQSKIFQNPGELLATIDLPGVLLFSGTLISLLVFLLSLSGGPLWLLLPVIPLAGGLLVKRELVAQQPFLNVRMLARNRRLVGVYIQYAALNMSFYALFFGLPLWLGNYRGFEAGVSGLLILPFAGISIIVTPLAAWLIKRAGIRFTLITGSVALIIGSLALQLFERDTAVPVILLVTAIIGLPTAFNNLGLQAAMYEAAPASEMGAASGLYQTFRYIGSILSTSLLGLVFGKTISSDGLHLIGYTSAVIALFLLVTNLFQKRNL
jgi:MFS family permease